MTGAFTQGAVIVITAAAATSLHVTMENHGKVHAKGCTDWLMQEFFYLWS
jgi:hypothetical protein